MLHVALPEQTRGESSLGNLADSLDIELKANNYTGVTVEEAASSATW
jgi:hypothetical protein